MEFSKIAQETMDHLGAGYMSLDNSPLNQQLRALIELKISQINNCEYCCKIHQTRAVKLGASKNKIENLPQFVTSNEFTEAEKAALHWAEQLTKLHGAPRVEHTNLSQYFSEREIVDITLCISLMNAFNRLNLSMR